MFRLALALFGTVAFILSYAIWFEYKHPCLEYLTSRVWVEKTTIYVSTSGGVPMEGIDSHAMPAIPVTTPAHWETIQDCIKRK